jgi:hypothetical protein
MYSHMPIMMRMPIFSLDFQVEAGESRDIFIGGGAFSGVHDDDLNIIPVVEA